jgi:amidase
LAGLILRREVAAEEVVGAFLARIGEVNPVVRALVQVAPTALSEAREADAELARGHVRGPLHGVPFTAMDVFDTAGIVSAAGIEARRAHVPGEDAVVIARLRRAGAILLGKTNCPPGGRGGDTENVLYGRTLNPYGLDRTPGGSSGGEAALIAAGGSPLGLGSDAGGGLRVPAHYCGVVALKPTVGRVPNTGAYNQPGGLTDVRTQIGPLARTVDDLAAVLPVIAGVDYFDAGVVPMPLGNHAAVDVRKLRVAFFAQDPASRVDPDVANAVGASAQALARAGVEVVEARPHNLVRDGRAITEAHGTLASLRGQDTVELFDAWDGFRTRLLQFIQHYDALLCPADHHPAPPWKERDPHRFDYTLPFSLAGWPSVVLPVAMTADGLPMGVQIVARPWREDVALALARTLETLMPRPRKPVVR